LTPEGCRNSSDSDSPIDDGNIWKLEANHPKNRRTSDFGHVIIFPEILVGLKMGIFFKDIP
jgi:hypothetical protein